MRLVVGGNYAWCLAIVVIFMGFGQAKKWGGFKVIICSGNANHKGVMGNFDGKGDSLVY